MSGVPTLRELRRMARLRLAAVSDSAARDAEILLLQVLGKSASWLYAHDDELADAAQIMRFDALLERRERGEPIAHLIGRRGFWTLDLVVNEHTLIPRPETELLVEFALEKLPAGAALPVLDLGTGSGAIALAVKIERPAAQVTAVDASRPALMVARQNASRLALAVEFREGNWFTPLGAERFALVLANPPYIAEGDVHLDEGDVRFEPRSALVAGADGLDDIRQIVAAAPAHLVPGGWLALEHGFDQAPAVRALLEAAGFAEVNSRVDLGGHERITFGCFHEQPALTDDELLRYARQIMLPGFDIAAQAALKKSRVLVVGLGGIGCPLAQYLAAAGVGELLLADFDRIDASNLQRQVLFAPADIGRFKAEVAAEKLAQQNPLIVLRALTVVLDADTLPPLLADVDLVVDGCDNFATRDTVNAACVAAGIPLVSAAAIGFGAQLAVFDARRPESPCYRCLYSDGAEAETTCAEAGVLAPITGVAGTLAATEALKMLTGVGEPLVGRLWLWDGMTGMMRTLSVRRDPGCAVCSPRKT